MKLKSSNPQLTARIGHALAREILKMKSRHATLVALSGSLGSGKTTFAQGFMKGLGVRVKIQSPTFIILKKFAIPSKTKSQFHTVFHIDAYRLKRAEEARPIGFKEIIGDQNNIILLEWPEKIKKFLPKNYILVLLRHRKSNHERMLTIQEIK